MKPYKFFHHQPWPDAQGLALNHVLWGLAKLRLEAHSPPLTSTQAETWSRTRVTGPITTHTPVNRRVTVCPGTERDVSKVTGSVHVGMPPRHICSLMDTSAQQWQETPLPSITGPGFESQLFSSCVTLGKTPHFSESYLCLLTHSRCSIDMAAKKTQQNKCIYTLSVSVYLQDVIVITYSLLGVHMSVYCCVPTHATYLFKGLCMGPPMDTWTHVSVRPFGLIIFSNNAHHFWVVFRGFSDYPSRQELVFFWVDTHMLARVCVDL